MKLFGLVQRMILWDLFKIFALAWFSLTALFLMAGLVAEATQQGLSPGQILAIMPYIIPSTLPYTLPTTTLFATCIVYGRLAADNEVLALKAAGVHLGHIVTPAIILGGAVSAATFLMYLDVIPYTHHELRSRFLRDVEEFLYSMLRRDGVIRNNKLSYTIYVKKVDERNLIDAIFMKRDASGGYEAVARAQEAEIRVPAGRKILSVHMKRTYVVSKDDNGFIAEKIFEAELPDFLDTKKWRAASMTWAELPMFREQFQLEADGYLAEFVKLKQKEEQGQSTEEDTKNKRKAEINWKHHQNLAFGIDAEFHLRPALTLGCLCFVLVGCPVGVFFSRSDYLSAFITCFLPIVTLYYPLLLCGINFAKTATVPPSLAIWPANMVMLAIAWFLFWRLLRN
ncbi:MAG: LptF/LptG family permease [Gemmataceae bacterium]|nr:LptF/LptG family permease [Gemmataceae bacterium]